MSVYALQRKKRMTRGTDPGGRHETSYGKLLGEHVKQASQIGTMAATLDVAIPFVSAMKKSHHDFMIRCNMEMNVSIEQRMQSEMMPMPVMKAIRTADYLLKNMNLTTNMYQSLLKLKEFTRSTDALLYIYSKERNELMLCPSHIHSPAHSVTFAIEEGKTFAIYVASSKSYIVTKDVLKDPRFPLGLGYLRICNEAAMGVPVISPSGDLLAVMELSKKAGLPPYQKKDELAALSLAEWMGSSVGISTSIQAFLNRHQFYNYIKHILIYYSSVGDLPFENILTHVMSFCEQYFNVLFGRLYVVLKVELDGKFVEKLVMFVKPESGNLFVKTNIEGLEVNNTVAQAVFRTKKLISLSGCDVDEYETWFKDDNITSIICQPIFGRKSKIVGAIEFCNKINEVYFTNDDEETLFYLSKYLCAMLKYYRLSLRKIKLKSKIGLYSEMLASHIHPGDAMIQKMREEIQEPPDLMTYGFFPKDLSLEYLSKLVVILMERILGACHFPNLDLKKFVATLAKGHDNEPPFTNFLHTFTVFHCAVIMMYENRGMFTKFEQENILMAALLHCFGISKLSLKYSKGQKFASFSTHFVNVFLKIFKLTDKLRSFWVNMLIKVCAKRNHRRFHSGLCRFILRDKFKWDDEIHRFYTMALVIVVAEDAMWYKDFQYTAYMSRRLFTQMKTEQVKLEERLKKHNRNRPNIRRSKKNINGKDFVVNQINDLRTKCLPNIEILSYLLPGAEPLLNLACRTVQQWELILKGEDCVIWEPEMSWPKYTKEDKEIYFSPIDFFIKEIKSNDDRTPKTKM